MISASGTSGRRRAFVRISPVSTVTLHHFSGQLTCCTVAGRPAPYILAVESITSFTIHAIHDWRAARKHANSFIFISIFTFGKQVVCIFYFMLESVGAIFIIKRFSGYYSTYDSRLLFIMLDSIPTSTT